MKRGFTLIELLAVIVILAIIALIAVPIVLNIINDVKTSSEEESIDLYVDQVQKIITKQNLKTKYSPNTCDIQKNGNIKCNGDINSAKETLEISIRGNKPSSGTIVFENDKITNIYDLVINGKKYNYDSTRKLKLLEIPENPGLYDREYKLLASWDELISYGLDTSNGELKQGIKDIINNNSNLSNSSMLIISNDITKIRHNAFYNCSQLESIIIPESVTNISYEAFTKSDKLKNIFIPSSILDIGTGAFIGCSDLISIKVDSRNSVFEDRGSNAIIKKSNNELIAGCQNTIIPESVTSIAGSAFQSSSLTNIIIPSSVTTIGSKAFSGCKDLKNITLSSGLKTISNHAFYYCNSLTNIVIPDSVTSIGESAFQDCWNLSNISLSSKLTSIESYTFRDCKSLTSIIIPENVVNIKKNAFFGCSSLKEAIFENTQGWYITDTNDTTTGINIDVTNENINPTNLRSTYLNKFWKRNSKE